MTTPTNSMPPTVEPGTRRQHLRAGYWLAGLSGVYGAKLATVKSWCFGPKNCFKLTRDALRQMVLSGNRDLADEKLADIELAFCGAPSEALPELLNKKAAADASEDVERTRYLQSRSDDERRRYERELRREIVADQQVLRSLEC